MHKLTCFSFFLALLFAAQVGPPDPRIGSWKLVSAHSSLDPPNRLSIASQHGEVHVLISGSTHADFTAKLNGHDTPVQDNPAFDQIELRRIDRHQVEVKEKKNGAVVVTIRDRLSKDANELTSRTSQAGRPEKISVWKRDGGKKSATDLFAGDWAEDVSKSRMAQGTVLKIDVEGAERKVLLGARNLINQRRVTNIIMEWNPESWEDLEILKQFRAYEIDCEKEFEFDRARRDSNVLLVPK